MNLELSTEQQLLGDSINRFLGQRYDTDARRNIIRSEAGWDPVIWQALAEELGVLGVCVAEGAGGFGGGPVEAMVVMEAAGRALVVEPVLENAVVAATLLQRAGGAVADSLLGEIIEGKSRVALAWSEPGSRYSRNRITTRAVSTVDGWRLSGQKCLVSSAPIATHLIFVARTAGEAADEAGLSLFLVENAMAGWRKDYRTIDDGCASDLEFDGLQLPAEALLGEVDTAFPVLDLTLDAACAASCAEAVGAMEAMLAATLDYTSQRKQFGQPLSRFQVLQHRMVDMYLGVEQARAAAVLAALKLSSPVPERRRAVAAAMQTVCRFARRIGQEAVQLHGAMGMTEELMLGHYFKRLTALQSRYGSEDYHLTRYAQTRAA
jgi:alkylation response protein AidB-like acyl-CoA dehydrogenase